MLVYLRLYLSNFQPITKVDSENKVAQSKISEFDPTDYN